MTSTVHVVFIWTCDFECAHGIGELELYQWINKNVTWIDIYGFKSIYAHVTWTNVHVALNMLMYTVFVHGELSTR